VKAGAVYETVTAAIVEQLEQGAELGEWRASWHGRHGMPLNAATGNAYRGGNVLALWGSQLRSGFGSEYWATLQAVGLARSAGAARPASDLRHQVGGAEAAGG
jgi:antirestriction protein ArdC